MPTRTGPVDKPVGRVAGLAAVVLMLGQVLWASDSYLLASIAACLHCVVAMVAIVLLRPEDRFWRGLAPFLLGLALMLAWLWLPESGLGLVDPALRFDREAFLPRWATQAGLAAVFLTGAAISFRRRGQQQAVAAIVGAGLCWQALALVLLVGGPIGMLGLADRSQVGRFVATQGNANVAGIMFDVVMVLSLGHLIQRARGKLVAEGRGIAQILPEIVVGVLVLGTGFACVLATASRAALFGGIAALLVLFAVALGAVFNQMLGKRFWLPTLLGMLTLAIALVGWVMIGLPLALDQKLQGTLADASQHVRQTLDFASWTWEAPWFGYGPGSFADLNRTHLDAQTAALRWDFRSAHSILVGDALEAGWPHALLALMVGTFCVWCIAHRDAATARDLTATAIMLAVGLTVLGGSLDISLDMPAVAALTAFLIGLLVGRAIRTRQEMGGLRLLAGSA